MHIQVIGVCLHVRDHVIGQQLDVCDLYER